MRSFNVAKIGDGCAPGPITKRLTDAYIAEVAAISLSSILIG